MSRSSVATSCGSTSSTGGAAIPTCRSTPSSGARRENVYITFNIVEGEPTRVTGLSVNGLDSVPEKIRSRVLVDLPLRQGDPFNRYVMQVTADTVTRRLRDRGYPSAKVFSSFETRKDANTATVAMEVDPGGPAVIGNVSVEGTNRVDPNLVRKLLVSRPGRLYSQDELFQSQRNLYRSDLFRFANVNIDSAKFTPGADSVPLLVQVNEAKRHRIRSGIGYGTDDCFRGSAAWTTRNFLGSNGRILDLTTRVSKVGVGEPLDWGFADNICSASREDTVGSAKLNYYLGATLRRPAFLSANNTISVSVFAERRSEFKVYLRQETGTTVLFRRETPRAADSPLAGVYPFVRPHRGDGGELLRLLQRVHAGPGEPPPAEPRARDAHRHRNPAAGEQPPRSEPWLARVARDDRELPASSARRRSSSSPGWWPTIPGTGRWRATSW